MGKAQKLNSTLSAKRAGSVKAFLTSDVESEAGSAVEASSVSSSTIMNFGCGARDMVSGRNKYRSATLFVVAINCLFRQISTKCKHQEPCWKVH